MASDSATALGVFIARELCVLLDDRSVELDRVERIADLVGQTGSEVGQNRESSGFEKMRLDLAQRREVTDHEQGPGLSGTQLGRDAGHAGGHSARIGAENLHFAGLAGVAGLPG